VLADGRALTWVYPLLDDEGSTTDRIRASLARVQVLPSTTVPPEAAPLSEDDDPPRLQVASLAPMWITFACVFIAAVLVFVLAFPPRWLRRPRRAPAPAVAAAVVRREAAPVVAAPATSLPVRARTAPRVTPPLRLRPTAPARTSVAAANRRALSGCTLPPPPPGRPR